MSFLVHVVDPFLAAHLWAGYAAARIGLRLSPWIAVMLGWEWLEAVGWGPIGPDPSPINSIVDVVVGLGAFLVTRYLPVRRESAQSAD